MAQSYMGYTLREIQLNGDRFLLTIPPTHTWNKLMEFQNRGIVSVKQWELECESFLFWENQFGEIVVINNTDDTIFCRYQKGQSPMYGIISAASLKFWPCLVPLTREGEVDDSFRSMDGQIVEGGFLQLERQTSRKTRSAIVGWSDHPAVWAFDHYKGINLLDSCNDPFLYPLKWCVCNGLLMGLQALVQVNLRELINFGMIPC